MVRNSQKQRNERTRPMNSFLNMSTVAGYADNQQHEIMSVYGSRIIREQKRARLNSDAEGGVFECEVGVSKADHNVEAKNGVSSTKGQFVASSRFERQQESQRLDEFSNETNEELLTDYTLEQLAYQAGHQQQHVISQRIYIEADSSPYDDGSLKEYHHYHHQQHQYQKQEQQQLENHHRGQCSEDQEPQHHPHHRHLQLQGQTYNVAELETGEAPALPEGGDNLRLRRQQRRSVEALVPTEEKSTGSHMPIVAMHRYGTETLSTTPIDHHHHHHHHQPQQQHHHQHHQQQINEQQQVLTRHLEEQQQQRHDEDQEDVDRVSGITAVMRGTRAEFNLNVLFPNMPSQNTSDSSGSTNSHHGHHQQHLEEVLHDDTYLQIRASTGTGEGVSPVPVRTGSSPGSSRSPHEDQQQQQQELSSPNRHNDTSNTYSPAQEPPRLQSFTHLTAMQPTVVSVNHLQDERVQSEQLYIDSIYAHHQQSTSHHHQEHEQSSTTSHSPTGPSSRCAKLLRNRWQHLPLISAVIVHKEIINFSRLDKKF